MNKINIMPAMRASIGLGALLTATSLSSAAFAQDVGLCGQPNGLTEGNFTISGSTAAPIDTFVNIARGEPRYLELMLQNPTGLTLETNSFDADPVLILFDSSGAVVQTDDDGTGTLNSRLGVDLPAGAYCLQVRTLTDIPAPTGPLPSGFDATIPLRVTTGVTPPVTYPTDGGQIASGSCASNPNMLVAIDPLSLGGGVQQLSGQLMGGGSASVGFTLSEPMGVALGVRSDTFDTIISLEDVAGVPYGTDDDGGDGVNSLLGLEQALQPGDYCLTVNSYDGASGGPFDVTLQEWSPQVVAQQTGGFAPFNVCQDPATTVALGDGLASGFAPLSAGQALTGTYSHFSFSTSQEMELRLSASSNNFDTVLGLYSMDGTEIARNDDAEGQGTNSRLQTGGVVPAGQYCAVVGSFSGSGGGLFDLSVLELTEEALLAEAYNRGELLPSVSSGVEMNDLGLLERSLRSETVAGSGAEWFLFEVDEESLVVMDTTSVGGVERIALFDFEGSGQMVAEGWPDVNGSRTRLVERVGSGIYAVAVVRSAYTEGREAMQMSLQRYVRPPRRQ
ncbi:hypothetical protein [Cochlodiniinecator piscidefendens]|uniref:hypothetical protein n=1 Tax=Cochlodiniinecator piscidefendens TaxID=2715756 RepID=UPI001408609C|nr:hypothetical protein [Cochlodiniinecator piscidefendens]